MSDQHSELYALLVHERTWEKVARSFHSHYERLAPDFGYEVRPDVGQRPFSELPENNRRLMVTTAGHVLRDLLDIIEAQSITRQSTPDGAGYVRFTPTFGDLVENTAASPRNPTRVGTFVQAIRRTGRLNPGIWWQLTDGKGRFWLTNPVHCRAAHSAEHRGGIES